MRWVVVGALVAAVLVTAGLFLGFRFLARDSDIRSPYLTPLTRLTQQDVDRITLRSSEQEIALVRGQAGWRVADYPLFEPKLDSFWALLRELDKMPTVTRDQGSHAALGVTESQALSVTLWNKDQVAGQLLISLHEPEVQATYIRRPPDAGVAIVGGDLRAFLSPTVESWRDPTILDASLGGVQSLRFSFPDMTFSLRYTSGDIQPGGPPRFGNPSNPGALGLPTPTPRPSVSGWTLETERGERVVVNEDAVTEILGQLAPLLADGFADDQWEPLRSSQPAWTLEMTRALFGQSRLEFHRKDAQTYYVRPGDAKQAFTLNAATVDEIAATARGLRDIALTSP